MVLEFDKVSLLEMESNKENISSPDTVLGDSLLWSAESETSPSKPSTLEIVDVKDLKLSKWANFVQLLKTKSKRHLSSFQPHNALKLTRSFSCSLRGQTDILSGAIVDSNLGHFKPHWKSYTFSQLQNATNKFNQANLIGKGGHAEVYKGCLKSGQLVAIKQLTKGAMDEKTGEFLSELGIMAHVNHPNTAKLIGYGVEGGLFLVLELSPHGSLASLLHSSKTEVEWHTRYKIALGIAEGLLYLHEGCQRRIIHRDIKSANILLTENLEPQICDFGLAKWLPENWTQLTISKFEGTFGYLAPEFLMHGTVDEKTDVFAFGVLLLELISGRRAIDHSQQSLVLWAKPLLRKNRIGELLDPSLGDDFNPLQMNLMILAAYICVQQSSIRRPWMKQVLQILQGSCGSLELVKKCKRPSYWKKHYDEMLKAEDYKLTKELNRSIILQKQISHEV